MKILIRNILVILLLGALVSSCVSNKPRGMRKSRKKGCDCPSFGHLESEKNLNKTYSATNG